MAGSSRKTPELPVWYSRGKLLPLCLPIGEYQPLISRPKRGSIGKATVGRKRVLLAKMVRHGVGLHSLAHVALTSMTQVLRR